VNVATNFLSSKSGQVLIAGGLLLIGAVLAAKYLKGFFDRYTQDTPYEGAGAVGALGKTFDDASGGVLSSVGGAIGQTIYDWTHNDANLINGPKR
jgi:hypothetical protein